MQADSAVCRQRKELHMRGVVSQLKRLGMQCIVLAWRVPSLGADNGRARSHPPAQTSAAWGGAWISI